MSEQCVTIAEVVENILYTPFNSGVLSNAAYDLGDILTCSGGIAGSGTLSCCVMSIDWTSKNLTSLQGFGADPSLTSGKSKTDKALSGLMSRTRENEVIFYTFENANDYELGDEELVDLLSIRFASVTPKIINLWHEIELYVEAVDSSKPIECQAFYYLDDDLISYSPITSWDNDGYHLLHLLYFLQSLEAQTIHEWEVKLMISNGTATIDVGDIHASLYGQGLVASDQWDGVIDASDVISARFGGSFSVTALTESVTLEEREIESINATDVVTATFGGSFEVSFSESISVLTDNILFDIYSADYDDQIVSSDGLWFLRSSQ